MQAVTSSVRPHGQTSKSDARSRRVKIMSAVAAHRQCMKLTQMHNSGRGRPVARHHSKQQLTCSTGTVRHSMRPQQRVCPCRRRVGGGKNHSPSVRCTDRDMPAHHELIARATTIRSSGASCSVRTRTVNQHVCFGQTAFLPTATRNANASATGCAFTGKCRVLSAKPRGERAGHEPRRARHRPRAPVPFVR